MKGYSNITDLEILIEYYEKQKFIHQICKEHEVGVIRVRNVIRADPRYYYPFP